MDATLELARQLIRLPSVTPFEAGCLDVLAARLAPLGFACQRLDSGPAKARVSNLWAKRASAAPQEPAIAPGEALRARMRQPQVSQTPVLAFAGHVDVVPPGPLARWSSPPFEPTLRGGKLYGRGASDMKTSIAAFVVAVEEFLRATPQPHFDIALLITSDEEGPALDGTKVVTDWLRQRGEPLRWCIVGEPTAVERTGDTIKNGRRGSLSGKLTIHGVQGHIAYPQLARNPIHQALPVLNRLAGTRWDAGNAFFQPTSWQISNIHAGTGAGNVIPGQVVVDFNFRFCTESSFESLQRQVQELLERQRLDFALEWTLGAQPFLTEPGDLVEAVQAAIAQETGSMAELSTSGGTSDARFLATLCPEVIELGPPNASIHQIDEHIALADIAPLKNIYRRTLQNLHALPAAAPQETADSASALP